MWNEMFYLKYFDIMEFLFIELNKFNLRRSEGILMSFCKQLGNVRL